MALTIDDFHQLHADRPDCNCIENGYQDTEGIYCRKIRGNAIEDSDLLSNWEKGKSSRTDSCDDVCDNKGVSVDKYTPEDEAVILAIYRQIFSIAPKKRVMNYCRFSFHQDAGILMDRSTPKRRTHRNFFKRDGFNTTLIHVISVDPI